ncbi:unnamed protein product [Prorocentrum cordatum]|uniref:Anoctamin transmembrane domain-containing protein n=1 Tax=Prorocentrum cordatum TaxID=2364126 RepID=A0ABN9U5X4_9DINO|nr:unnamed protein product [Polarella glacialis]
MPFQLEKTTRIIESYNNSRSSPRRRFTKERNARDMYGRPVPAYTTFEFDVADDLEPFRQVDEIRLIQLCLTDWLNMSELVQQGVVSKWFPAANYDAVQTLGKHWGNIRKAWSCDAVPNLVTFKVGDGKPLGDEIRDYFGEEVAFFWMWFTHYVRMLVPLALVGTVCALRYVVLAESAQRRVEIGFCIVMLLWATVFCDVFKRKTDRCRQRWGMKDFEAVSADLHGYNEAAEGTWHNEMKRHLAVVGVGAYCLFFMGVVAVAEYNLKEAQRKGAATNGALITVGIIQGGSFVWNRIAPKLADLQNHKTQARWNDALVWILSGPKLFVVLYPFLSVAFLKKFYNRECTEQQSSIIDQHGLANLAWMTYSGNGWPSGIPNRTELESAGGPHDIGDKFDLSWFRPYTYQGDMKQCIWGCYPVDCRHDIEAGSLISENGNWAAFRSEWSCKTNCWMELTGRLTSFWVFQIITHLVFLAVPIVLMRVEVYKELYGKSSRRDRPAEDGAREAYSFLQYQAKCP